MSWQVKVISVNRKTGHTHERTLKRRYRSNQEAQQIATQLCVSAVAIESTAVAIHLQGVCDGR